MDDPYGLFLKKLCLTLEAVQNILIEVELTINNHPLPNIYTIETCLMLNKLQIWKQLMLSLSNTLLLIDTKSQLAIIVCFYNVKLI